MSAVSANVKMLPVAKPGVQPCGCPSIAPLYKQDACKDSKSVQSDEEYFVVPGGAAGCSSKTPANSPEQPKDPAIQASLGTNSLSKTLVAAPRALRAIRSFRSANRRTPGSKRNLLHTYEPYSLTLNSVGAAPGIVTQVHTVYADTNATEWAAFATIFDEYRVLGGRVHYCLDYASRAIPAGGYTMDDNFVLAYDPLNGTALTSVRQGTEIQCHELSMSRFEAAVVKTWNNWPVSGRVLHFKTPHDTVLANTAASAVDAAPGSWKKIFASGSNGPDGYIRSYGITGFVTTTIALNAIVVLDVEFRIRL